MTWADPMHSRTAVRRAGKTYIDPTAPAQSRDEALDIINNWRSAHGFPLNSTTVVLRQRAKSVDPDATVAQRIKRLPSITSKLRRYSSMELDRIQDIGGCRAVVEDLARLKALEERFLNSRSRHVLVRRDDYVWENPKLTGYRGIHLVYAYRGAKTQYEDKALKVEVQLRTRLQHAWATALETVDTFTKQALKSSRGDADWLRFFALIASVLAAREGTARIPETPSDQAVLLIELRALAQRLNVIDRLAAYGATLNATEQDALSKGDKYFVLTLEPDEGWLEIRGFRDLTPATAHYDAEERVIAEYGERRDVVLVSVEATTSLRRAYPNYFLDTEAFVFVLQDILS